MRNNFVPFEYAKELKDLGFNENCFAYYDLAEELKPIDHDLVNFRSLSDGLIYAPLWQQAFKFFRDNYKLSGIPLDNSYEIFRIEFKDNLDIKVTDCVNYEYPYSCFEQAQWDCIFMLIRLAKEA